MLRELRDRVLPTSGERSEAYGEYREYRENMNGKMRVFSSEIVRVHGRVSFCYRCAPPVSPWCVSSRVPVVLISVVSCVCLWLCVCHLGPGRSIITLVLTSHRSWRHGRAAPMAAHHPVPVPVSDTQARSSAHAARLAWATCTSALELLYRRGGGCASSPWRRRARRSASRRSSTSASTSSRWRRSRHKSAECL
jgi:hypothetical protein